MIILSFLKKIFSFISSKLFKKATEEIAEKVLNSGDMTGPTEDLSSGDKSGTILLKLNNGWQFLAYAFWFHKWKLLVMSIFVVAFIIVLNYTGVELGKILDVLKSVIL